MRNDSDNLETIRRDTMGGCVVQNHARLFVSLFAVAVVIVLSAFAHSRAAFYLPHPWPDESAFVWPAIAFQEENTFLAPQVNPERPLMWMPPGYYAVVGLLLKVTGFSFVKVRWISWAFSVVAYLALLYFFKDRKTWYAYLVLISLTFLNVFFLVMGNVARMESLLVSVVLVGFLFLQCSRPWEGLSILAGSVLIHPNGLFFCALAGLWSIWKFKFTWPKPCLSAKFLICGVLVLVIGYGVYVLGNWNGFMTDMKWQYASKTGHDFSELWLSARYIAMMLAYLLLFFVAVIFTRDLLLQVLFGMACLLIRLVGNEMWYAVYVSIALLILLCTMLDLIRKLAEKIPATGSKPSKVPQVAVYLSVIGMILLGGKIGVFDLSARYPYNLKWCDMTIKQDSQYFNSEDAGILLKKIREKLPAGSNSRVAFLPPADALLLYPRSKEAFHSYEGLFFSQKADLIVVHKGSMVSDWWSKTYANAVKSLKLSSGDIVYSRGDNDWYVMACR